ncbi:MAG: amidohydrolase family protein [Desulfobulbaceae bacterium]|nr:amidohydrolase family protein [Desulfobulbaceae bacterium]
MTRIIDFHTHAFPDDLAATAIPYLEKEGNVKAYLNGTVDDLLRSMDRAEIDKSVICSIATRAGQFRSILDWSKKVRSDRLIPLPSVHPAAADLAEQVRIIREEGFIGIKLHPYYQDFFIDEDRLSLLYASLIEHNLLVVMHTGFDIAFPRLDLCTPQRILKVLDSFPALKIITTHLGAWDDWEQVRRLLIGRPVYMEISYALDFLDPVAAREMILQHPPEYVLFGSDSPWSDQKNTLQLLRSLDLDPVLVRKITGENAELLLR